MAQLEKLLDAWRADPRVESTVELGNMLLRANMKAKGALPRDFIVQFGDEAARKHPQHMEVLEVLSRLFAVSGEGSRATALYARSALLFPGDPRVTALERALKSDGVAVPPPEVAAKHAPPPPPPEPLAPAKKVEPRRSELPPKKSEAPPPKRELAAPRPLQTSLADFMPPKGAKELPIDPSAAFPIDMEPSTSTGIHTDPTRDVPPPHVHDVPTSQLALSGIEAALGEDTSIPRRPRAPTIGGLGLPAPPLPAGASTTPALGAPPSAAAGGAAPGPPPPRVRPPTAVQGSGLVGAGALGAVGPAKDPPPASAAAPETALAPTRPGPSRRSPTLVAEHGVAPPPAPGDAPPARVNMPAEDAASPIRMFTPVRAFTPPPGNLAWGEPAASPPKPPAEGLRDGDDTTQGGEATTNIIHASARAAAGMMIDSPTTTQETITKPVAPAVPIPTLRGAPGDQPPTQTRLVPQEDQLRAAAASLMAHRPSDGQPTASRPAARRAGAPARERIRFDADDDPPTGVTSTATDTQVTVPPVSPPARAIPEMPDLGLDLSEAEGQATARRNTSELLAAALLPRAPNGAPALGAPSASTPPPAPARVEAPRVTADAPVPSLGPAPALPPPSMPGAGARPSGPTPANAAGPVAKPTLVSRSAPVGGPPAKPTLVSRGSKSPARPQGAPPGPPPPPSSGPQPLPRASEAQLDTADETSTKVRRPDAGASLGAPHLGPQAARSPSALPPPPPLAAPSAAPAAAPTMGAPAATAPRPPVTADSSTMSRAITDLWEPPAKRPSSPAPDPRREPDDDGPSTNVIQVSEQGRPLTGNAAGVGPSVADGARPAVARTSPIADDPSFAEELSSAELETADDLPIDTSDQPTGRVEVPRGKPRSTQKIAGTVAPAVAWSPASVSDEAAEGGVRTRVLTAEQSAAAGRVDPLPSAPPSAAGSDWMITPPPPVAPRFGPPPASVRPSVPPSQRPMPMSVPPSRPMQPSMGPSSLAPRAMEGDGRGARAPATGSPSPILVGSVIGVALSVLVAGGVWLYGLASETKPAATTQVATPTDVDGVVFGGRKEDLDRADALLSGPVPAGSEKVFALARARERALRALELGTTERISDALDDARKRGVAEEELAFLELAKAVADRNGEAERALIAKWAERRKSDAFFLLAAGASLEQHGDRTAVEKYGAALGAEPRLRPAALRLARAELLDGDSTRGVARVEGLAAQGSDAPEVLALRALVWLRSREERSSQAAPAPSVPQASVLPIELRFIPTAVDLVTSKDAGARRAALEDAAKKADTPSVEVLFGSIALDLRVEASAMEIARKALRRAPEYPEALSLFARSGLALAKLDVLDEVGRSLPTAQQKLLQAITAYERGDVATVVETRTWLGQRDELGREGIVARAERLVGAKPMPPARIQALQRPEIAGGDLVAVDALLDAGDLAGAREIVSSWGDPTSHPLRALRAARLLRYDGKASEAEAALDVSAPTQPALVERVLIEADKADERAHARSMLDARFGEDRFYYEVYLLALDDRMPAAQKLLDSLPVPGDDAPLARRVAAALAFGAVDDKDRGRELVRRLAELWPRNPDVARAKRALDGRRR